MQRLSTVSHVARPDAQSIIIDDPIDNARLACVDLASGAVRWTAPGGGPSTVAVLGDHMAVLTDKPEVGLLAYRITPERADKLWSLPNHADRGASPLVHAVAINMAPLSSRSLLNVS